MFDDKKLFKCFDMFWQLVYPRNEGSEFIAEKPFCSNDSCRVPLDQKNLGTTDTGTYKHGYKCSSCEKEYDCRGYDYLNLVEQVRKKYEGYKRLNHQIYSLDLPPTKVKDDTEDENYWVQARISEKSGKRMAVIYFGQRIKGEQSQKDYSQVFLDFEDEQLRFDKTNKNPMKLLAKLIAEFPESNIEIIKKINN